MRIQHARSMWKWTMCLIGLVVVLAACGGDAGGDTDGDPASAVDDVQGSAGGSGDGSSGGDEANGGSGQAMATLEIGDDTHVFEGNEWTYCEIGGVFPVSAEFQKEAVKWDGDWFQFLDRGDGGVNFSAVFDGEEYSGTGPGEADEVTSNGFTYTGALNRGGEVLDTVLEVSC